MSAPFARRPASLWLACALGAVLGADALLRANALRALGAYDPLATLRAVLMIGVAAALFVRPHPRLALAQAALALWVYVELAPVVGDLAAHGFAGLALWLRPLPLAAFAFFPVAFFAWRALARGSAPA